jgi:uncharacterized protein
MRRANGAAEPSMDEILASIRQIIESSDSERISARSVEPVHADVAAGTTAGAANWNEHSEAAYTLRPSYEGSVAYDLAPDDQWYAEEPVAEQVPEAEPIADAWADDGGDMQPAFAAEPEEPAMPAYAANNDEPRMREYRDAILHDQRFDDALGNAEPLISEDSEAAINASFAELTEAIRAGELRSLEEMAQEMLRPMMQQWLEENLARTVQEIVREEIRRAVTRGR